MSLQQDVMAALKEAMKAKDQTALTALRAVKSAILLAQTGHPCPKLLLEILAFHSWSSPLGHFHHTFLVVPGTTS